MTQTLHKNHVVLTNFKYHENVRTLGTKYTVKKK